MVSKNSISTIKQLPNDIDAELDLLGMCLLAQKAPEIESDFFYQHKNQDIAKTMQLLVARDKPLDPANILRELRKSRDDWKGKKGTLYLAELIERVPCYVQKIEAHNAKQVRKTANLRKIIEFMGEIIMLAQELGANPVDLAAKIQSKAYEIEMPKSNLIPIKNILKDVILNLEKRIENPESLMGITTGLRTLDNASSGGFLPGELWVIAGRPGMGKSALAWGMATSVAKAGHKVLGVSLEMGPDELGRRFLSKQSLVSATKLRTGRKMEESWSSVMDAANRLMDLPIFLEEKSQINEIELQRIISKIKPEVVFIDYLQLMIAAGRFHNRESEISHLTRSLKNMARSFNVSIVILSQLNRDLKGRSSKLPQLTDLRESGAIEQDADIVLGLHRGDEPEGEAEICVLKNRNGKIGKLKVYWKGSTMTYRDLAF
ncbi:AAA family ATPase [bacterium]|nr:AAA family ATPase [bacterium]